VGRLGGGAIGAAISPSPPRWLVVLVDLLARERTTAVCGSEEIRGRPI
jgi:hypothetical protein